MAFISGFVSKETLFETIEEEIQKSGKQISIGMDKDHLPDRSWLVNILHLINPKHSYFINKFGVNREA